MSRREGFARGMAAFAEVVAAGSVSGGRLPLGGNGSAGGSDAAVQCSGPSAAVNEEQR